ncbi:MAG TPA: hypothetical protein VFV99_24285 [Kofleriaceae bacterium]|nr:hypothetical protein [Kofleriaceae bacterium]
MKHLWMILVLACVFVTPASAKKYGRQVRYAGIHPVSKAEGGGICHIEFPHVHVYPANKLEYRVVADNNVFVGDPVAYGWDGPKYAYKGAHPIQVNVLAGTPEPYVHYCYLSGPHYHYFEPADDDDYKVVGDAYFYVGTPPPAMIEARPAYVGINAVYTPLVYTRPVIEVEPPSAWIMLQPGFVVEAAAPVVVAPAPPRGHIVGGVGVSAGVSVHIPVPTVSVGVQVGGPAVIVPAGRGHGKFKHKKWKRR